MSNDILIVDIREEHELLSSRLIPLDSNVNIINIPSRNLFSNVEWINSQSAKMPVWLICASGNRSKSMKELYFSNNDGIKSVDEGINYLQNGKASSPNDFPVERVVKQNGTGGFGLQQYIQLAFSIMLLLALVIVYLTPNRVYALVFIGTLFIIVLGQALSKSCMMSKFIPKSRFIPINK